MLLEYAICNEWDYFVTLTLDPKKVSDRSDLKAYHDKLMQWMKDQKKNRGFSRAFLLVPERHKDGSWHLHGFLKLTPEEKATLSSFSDMDKAGYRVESGRRLPKKLRQSDYLYWPAYAKSFGHGSLGPVRDSMAAAFYATKYISKDVGSDVLPTGAPLYWASRGLQRSTVLGDFVNRADVVDFWLHNHYKHCATGFVAPNKEFLGWDTETASCIIEALDGVVGGSLFSPVNIYPSSLLPSEAEQEADRFDELDQMTFKLPSAPLFFDPVSRRHK